MLTEGSWQLLFYQGTSCGNEDHLRRMPSLAAIVTAGRSACGTIAVASYVAPNQAGRSRRGRIPASWGDGTTPSVKVMTASAPGATDTARLESCTQGVIAASAALTCGGDRPGSAWPRL